MNFSDFISQSWNDHAMDSASVAERLSVGMTLMEAAKDIPPYVNLLLHVVGEHLGRWDEGLKLLKELRSNRYYVEDSEAEFAILRAESVFSLCKGDSERAIGLANKVPKGVFPEESVLIRVYATATAALVGQSRMSDGIALWKKALSLASYDMRKDDPAARALAVTANNLASDLEERSSRTGEETNLMKHAAQTARKFWEIAGSWLEIERAEYRLAMTSLAAGEPTIGLKHEDLCLTVCKANQASLFEQFFAHQARAKCLIAIGDKFEAQKARNSANANIESMLQSAEYLKEQLKLLDQCL